MKPKKESYFSQKHLMELAMKSSQFKNSITVGITCFPMSFLMKEQYLVFSVM